MLPAASVIAFFTLISRITLRNFVPVSQRQDSQWRIDRATSFHTYYGVIPTFLYIRYLAPATRQLVPVKSPPTPTPHS